MRRWLVERFFAWINGNAASSSAGKSCSELPRKPKLRVTYEEEPGRRSAAKLLTRDEARRIDPIAR